MGEVIHWCQVEEEEELTGKMVKMAKRMTAHSK